MPIIDTLLTLLAPHDCVACNAEGSLLCDNCCNRLDPPIIRCYKCHTETRRNVTCVDCRTQSALTSVHPAVKYTGAAKDLVWKLKFGRTHSAAREIACIIESKLRMRSRLPVARRIIITHAPTATTRVRQRGYDQAALIARHLASRAGVTYMPLLARSGQQKQIGATRSQRTLQLQSAFRPLRLNIIQGAHIILIDDVVTTGATLEAAAEVLRKAGARRVDAIVFAQA